MKLTIMGPEGKRAELTRIGRYTLKKVSIGFVDHTLVEANNGEQQIIAVGGHTSISREHLRISLDGVVLLTDLGSKYGSFLDGRRFTRTEISTPGEYDLTVGKVPFALIYHRHNYT